MKIMRLLSAFTYLLTLASINSAYGMIKSGDQSPLSISGNGQPPLQLIPGCMQSAKLENSNPTGRPEDEVYTERVIAIIHPFLNAPLYKQMNLPLPSPLCLWGPEGVGKTHSAYVIANQLDSSIVEVESEELLYSCIDSKNIVPVGKLLEKLDERLSQVRRQQLEKRKKVATVVINNMDKLFHPDVNFLDIFANRLRAMIKSPTGTKILLIGECRREPSDDMKSFFKQIIRVPLPTQKERAHILTQKANRIGIARAEDVVMENIASETDRFTPKELKQMLQAAAFQALLEASAQTPALLRYAHILKPLLEKRAEITPPQMQVIEGTQSPKRGSGASSPMKEEVRRSMYA